VFFGVNRQIVLYSGDKGHCVRLSTSGVDGQLVIWDLKVTFLDFTLCRYVTALWFILSVFAAAINLKSVSKQCVFTTPPATYSQISNFVFMLPVPWLSPSVALACDNVYPLLWMTACFPIMGLMGHDTSAATLLQCHVQCNTPAAWYLLPALIR